MRGIDHQQGHVFSYLSPEERVRKDHPLRVLREMTDNILREMSRCSTACMRSVDGQIESMIEELITSLPDPKQLTSEERRGMIARYTAVLEGNFIYWMTAAYLAVQSEEARPLLIDNLYEEVRDAHPAMLRRFTIAAHAFPTDTDALVVHEDLTKVRVFLGRLSGVQSVVTVAFFEGFIQRFHGLPGRPGCRAGLDRHGIYGCSWSLRHRAHARTTDGTLGGDGGEPA
jgi:hypothetical protein